MKCFSYVVARDYGFAPNPFSGYCTLATCKPNIRKSADIGDWVIGTGSSRVHGVDRLVFAMQVTEKLMFDEYWADPRFISKRPVMNGSLKQMYGDNIYHRLQGRWHQVDSHHSNEDGTINKYNLRRDTSYKFILVSDQFFYFGCNAVHIPLKFRRHDDTNICKKGPGHRCNFPEGFAWSFIVWLQTTHHTGYHGDPAWFTHFERYGGVSKIVRRKLRK